MNPPARRRDLLASIGTVVCAGCLSNGARTGSSDEPTIGSVTLDATVVDSFNASHPGRLRLTLENQTDGLLLSLGVRRGIDGPFTAIRGSRQDDGRELLLFYRGRDLDSYALCEESSDTPIPEARVDGCWQPRCASGLEIISTHGRVVLGPGETLSGEYTVLDGFDEGCLAPGTYSFSDDASELGAGEKTAHGVEFESDPTRVVRHLDVTIGEGGTLSTSAEVVFESDDGADRSTTRITSGETPGSVLRNESSA